MQNSKVDKFADDSKLDKSLSSQADVECLRKDLINMEKLSNEWQMKFNTDKCTVMHLGRKNKGHFHSQGYHRGIQS